MILLFVIQIRKCYLYYLQWHLDFATLQMTQVIKIGYFVFNVAKGANQTEMKQTKYNKKKIKIWSCNFLQLQIFI